MRKIRILLFLGAACAALTEVMAADKPNILWLVSEDNGTQWLGCYGNKQAQTPRLDALAKEGILFEHVYSNAPVCAVARATLLMGAYSPTMGTQHMRSRHPVPGRFKSYVDTMAGLGYFCENPGKTDYNIEMDDKAPWKRTQTGGGSWKNTPDGKPFLVVRNFGVTHESTLFDDMPQEPERLKPSEINLPPYLPDLPEVRKDFARYHDRITAMDKEIGQALDQLEAAGLADDTIVFYFSDHGGPTPRGKRYLEDTGVRVPLIVRVPEKWRHLSPFKPGERVGEPLSFVDFAPTIISMGGGKIPAVMQGRAFLGKDRTGPAKDEMEFLYADRFDENYGMRRGLTDGHWKYIRCFTPNLPAAPYSDYQYGMPSWRAIRDAWQGGKLEGYHRSLWESPQPVERLYDVAADPWEMHNLANDPKHAERLEKMRERLKATMVRIRDTGLIPEPMFNEITDGRPVADHVAAEGFGIAEKTELAFAASASDPTKLARLIEATRSGDPVDRYWGAHGLLVLGDQAGTSAENLVTMLKDVYSVNRVTAARALIAVGSLEQGRKALADELAREPKGESMLNLINALTGTGNDALVSDGWIDRALKESVGGNEYVKRYANRLKGSRE